VNQEHDEEVKVGDIVRLKEPRKVGHGRDQLVLTQSPHSFFTKLFHKRVNARRERAIRFRVSFGPRARRELFSTSAAKSP
jgi:hypothetical protein